MSEIKKLMSFDEFRASADAADVQGETVRRQLDHFRDDEATDELLRPESLSGMNGWIPWDAAVRTAS